MEKQTKCINCGWPETADVHYLECKCKKFVPEENVIGVPRNEKEKKVSQTSPILLSEESLREIWDKLMDYLEERIMILKKESNRTSKIQPEEKRERAFIKVKGRLLELQTLKKFALQGISERGEE